MGSPAEQYSGCTELLLCVSVFALMIGSSTTHAYLTRIPNDRLPLFTRAACNLFYEFAGGCFIGVLIALYKPLSTGFAYLAQVARRGSSTPESRAEAKERFLDVFYIYGAMALLAGEMGFYMFCLAQPEKQPLSHLGVSGVIMAVLPFWLLCWMMDKHVNRATSACLFGAASPRHGFQDVKMDLDVDINEKCTITITKTVSV